MFELNRETGRQEAPGADLGQILDLERELQVLEQSITDAKEELENLQAELLHTRQEEAEAKALTKGIFEEAEKKETEFREKRNKLEEECADLSDRSSQMSDDLDRKSKELQTVTAELKEIQRQRDLSGHNRKRRFAITAVLVFLMVVLFFGYVGSRAKVSELKDDISEWKDLCQSTTKEKADALAKISELKSYTGTVMIRVNHVYNANEEGSKISDDLKSSEMRYIHYDFDILFLEDMATEADIYVDLYNPDGSLNHSTSSPAGHTTHYNVRESCNMAAGWGNSSRSNYKAGVYRIDFVYEGRIIHSQKIEISD